MFLSRVGKVGYRAPEVLGRHGYNGFFTDAYALGIMTYNMATNSQIPDQGKLVTNAEGDLIESLRTNLENHHYGPDTDLYKFIRALVQEDPFERLPAGPAPEKPPILRIFNHEWLSGMQPVNVGAFQEVAELTSEYQTAFVDGVSRNSASV